MLKDVTLPVLNEAAGLTINLRGELDTVHINGQLPPRGELKDDVDESDEEVEEDSNDSASESESEHFAPVLALIDDADPSTSLSLLEECDILVSSFTR
jgi:hypothetical protein